MLLVAVVLDIQYIYMHTQYIYIYAHTVYFAIYSPSNRNEYKKYFVEVKAAGA